MDCCECLRRARDGEPTCQLTKSGEHQVWPSSLLYCLFALYESKGKAVIVRTGQTKRKETQERCRKRKDKLTT